MLNLPVTPGQRCLGNWSLGSWGRGLGDVGGGLGVREGPGMWAGPGRCGWDLGSWRRGLGDVGVLGSLGGAWDVGGAWGVGGRRPGQWSPQGSTLSPPTPERPQGVSLNDSLASLDDCREVSLAR